MANTSYKKWSKETRTRSGAITRRMKKEGIIQQPKCCERCKQDKGIIHWHNEDYDVTLSIGEQVINRIPMGFESEEEKAEYMGVLESLCWTCHMMHHSKHRDPKRHDLYFKMVAKGYTGDPVYKHNFAHLLKYSKLETYGREYYEPWNTVK